MTIVEEVAAAHGGVQVVEIPHDAAVEVNEYGLGWVELVSPGQSARHGLGRRQRAVLVGTSVAVLAALIVWPQLTMRIIVALCTFVYLTAVGHRLWLVRVSLGRGAGVSVTDEDALAVPDDELPTYAVLVPAYKEPEVIGHLISSLERLDYPRDRLVVKLLLEHGDPDTLAAARAYDVLTPTDLAIDIIVLPPGDPQTKPRALNFGLQCSDSDLVTIFDAEDRPEPLQLRRAAVAFDRLGPEYACLQARLEFDDRGENLLSKWFVVEYLTWFRLFIGGITLSNGVVPLGGTSNHFRRDALDAVGAWDPYNVTEDADLGVRLQRHEMRVGLLDSVTTEEVNSDIVNWVKQRSRWQKGYLQTSVVHLRSPRRVIGDLGLRRWLHLMTFMAGTPLLAVANLFYWGMFVAWLATRAGVIEQLFPSVVYYLALGSLVAGNLSMIYLGVITLLQTRRHDHLLGAALLSPLYWVLISIAAVRAVVQLVIDPFHWEKTQHGIGVSAAAPAAQP
ncbi:MAG: glycosyltransferase [Acidimicrobiales bacterium]